MIDYDPPGSDTNTERVGLTLLSGDNVSLSGFTLSYDGKIYRFSTGSLSSGQELLTTGNFVFVNSRPVCISLYNSSQLLIDTACYNPSQDISPFLPFSQSSTNSGQLLTGEINEDIDYRSLQFDIRSLVYDPPGSDTNTETVIIYFSGGVS